METVTLENISKQELASYQQLFSIFDKEDNGTIPTKDISIFIRGLGHCPTEEEICKIKEQLDPKKQGFISFKNAVSLALNRAKEQNTQQELMDAFQHNSDGTHSEGEKTFQASSALTKKFMTEYGEKLTEAEAELFSQFLKANNLNISQKQFNYKQATRILAYAYMP